MAFLSSRAVKVRSSPSAERNNRPSKPKKVGSDYSNASTVLAFLLPNGLGFLGFTLLPTAILTIALQKYIIEGISISGFGGR